MSSRRNVPLEGFQAAPPGGGGGGVPAEYILNRLDTYGAELAALREKVGALRGWIAAGAVAAGGAAGVVARIFGETAHNARTGTRGGNREDTHRNRDVPHTDRDCHNHSHCRVCRV
jgi:hypothetical protein